MALVADRRDTLCVCATRGKSSLAQVWEEAKEAAEQEQGSAGGPGSCTHLWEVRLAQRVPWVDLGKKGGNEEQGGRARCH